jgi:hypothetical protein
LELGEHFGLFGPLIGLVLGTAQQGGDKEEKEGEEAFHDV